VHEVDARLLQERSDILVLQVSPLSADAVHLFARWPVSSSPPAILLSADVGTKKAASIKVMRVWLRRRSHASTTPLVARQRLLALTSSDASSTSVQESSSFEPLVTRAQGAATHTSDAPTQAANSEACAGECVGLYSSARSAGLIAPPHDRPELLGASIAEHWCAAQPLSLAMRMPHPQRAAAELRCSVRSVGSAMSLSATHLAQGCKHAEAFVQAPLHTPGEHINGDALANHKLAAAGFLGSAREQAASASGPGAQVKLAARELAAAYRSREIWPADDRALAHFLKWCKQELPDAEQPDRRATPVAAAKELANQARQARGQPAGVWGRSTALTAADEVRINKPQPFALPEVDGVDLMQGERQGAAALQGIPKPVQRVLKTMAYVRACLVFWASCTLLERKACACIGDTGHPQLVNVSTGCDHASIRHTKDVL
jgi:hypothetical protein